MRAGWYISTPLPSFDFETYSEAGFIWDEASQKYKAPQGAAKKGLPAVGAAVYAEHPSCEILSLSYDLLDGRGAQHWKPGDPAPHRLFDHIADGGLLEAHNSSFEHHIWNKVGVRRYGWPPLPQKQLRCSMAKARASSYPGALGNLGDVLNLPLKKDKDGDRLLKKFSIPRDPTLKDPKHRIRPEDDPADAANLYKYNETDIKVEALASERIPDLIPQELDYWLADQACNYRGVGIDRAGVEACVAILEQAHAKYNAELYQITGGQVARASEVAKLTAWVYENSGVRMAAMDTEAVENALARNDLPHHVRRALDIRGLIGSASVKKVYAMARMATSNDRLCDLFIYHGARTGRDAHADVQPGNLPKAGPKLRWCAECNWPGAAINEFCAHCGWAYSGDSLDSHAWDAAAVPYALEIIGHKNLELVEYYFGTALLTVSGCVRGLFTSAPGKDLICSDYSSIEAVVTAVLAGEAWRVAAFERREDIYIHGAASVTGQTYEWYMANGGKKHPDRNKIGKVAELALGFGGWIGSWRNFDKSDNFNDAQVKELIIKWRDASPAIVELWGGQCRGKPWAPTSKELYGLEGMAIAAILNPGTAYAYNGITYQMATDSDALYCRLLSGRVLTYHSPRLAPSTRWEGQLTLSFMGWNSNPTMGPLGWIRIETYGSRLAENVVQATARDIMAHAVVNLERVGYPVVLRVHDELAAEVPEGFGSVDDFERIMATLPEWAAGWPIRAAGGWRKKRYQKD